MKEHSTTPEGLPPLELRELRSLDLTAAPAEGMPSHVASASGVVRRGDYVYVIGDDLLQLAIFEIAANRPGHLFPVLSGDLGGDAERRSDPDVASPLLSATMPVDPRFDG